jgi:MEMO1 family protein
MNIFSSQAGKLESPTSGDARARSVVCAVLMPHAPILVPAVGGERGRAAEATCRAMREAAAAVLSYRPEVLVVITPHAPRRRSGFGLWTGDCLEGSFDLFAAPQVVVTLPNAATLVNGIIRAAQVRDLQTWVISKQSLDHGALVPLWFLMDAGWSGPTVVVGLNYPEDGGLTRLGEAIAEAANSLWLRVAVIASGDMSHRLTENAPCGFHPEAHQFDLNFIRLLELGKYRELENIDPQLREFAAEDVVDSTLIAVSAVGWQATSHRVLNYEGPFGVGYGVAILFAENCKATGEKSVSPASSNPDGAILPTVARRSVESALRDSSELPPPPNGGYLAQKHGVFVTVRRRDGKLRGCVGTIVPVCANLVAETWRSARLAAFQDGRFMPVAADDLGDLQFQVSILHSLEIIASTAELNPQHYGVIVSTSDGRRGLLLPGIKKIKTGDQQLVLARRKGWIEPDEPVTIQRFQADHFEETT